MNINIKVRVVLVEPLYEINIGYIARCMRNFGLSELYIVNPKTKIADVAYQYAMHGREILKKAVIVSKLEEALKGVNYVIGTTGKVASRSLIRIVIPIEKFISLIKAGIIQGKIALLFGREDIGLTNEILALCDYIVTIPANPEYPILNISHAAVIFFYELYKLKSSRQIPSLPYATREDKDLLVKYFKEFLEALNLPENRFKQALIAFRRVIGKSQAYHKEIASLYSVFRKAIKLLKENMRQK